MLQIQDTNGQPHELEGTVVGENIKHHLALGDLTDRGYPGAILVDVTETPPITIEADPIDVAHNTRARIIELEQRALRSMREIMLGNGDVVGLDGKTASQRLSEFETEITQLRNSLQVNT